MYNQTATDQKKLDRVQRMRELRDRLQLSSSHIYALIAAGRFPRPFRIVSGGRAAGWLESEITEWILARKAAPQGGAL